MDPLTKVERSRLMARIRQKGTEPELRLRVALRQHGIKYRTNTRLPGTPDIAVSPGKVAIFVDGCFWHGCPLHGSSSKTNASFWSQKIQRNKERDNEVDKALRKLGWKSVRVWEHDVDASLLEKTTSRVIRTILKRAATVPIKHTHGRNR